MWIAIPREQFDHDFLMETKLSQDVGANGLFGGTMLGLTAEATARCGGAAGGCTSGTSAAAIMNDVDRGGSGSSVVAKRRTTIAAQSTTACTRNDRTNVRVRIALSNHEGHEASQAHEDSSSRPSTPSCTERHYAQRPWRVAATPQLPSQKLPCHLRAPLNGSRFFHREDGRTGGPGGVSCSSCMPRRGDCAVFVRRRAARNKKILASLRPPILPSSL